MVLLSCASRSFEPPFLDGRKKKKIYSPFFRETHNWPIDCQSAFTLAFPPSMEYVFFEEQSRFPFFSSPACRVAKGSTFRSQWPRRARLSARRRGMKVLYVYIYIQREKGVDGKKARGLSEMREKKGEFISSKWRTF